MRSFQFLGLIWVSTSLSFTFSIQSEIENDLSTVRLFHPFWASLTVLIYLGCEPSTKDYEANSVADKLTWLAINA